jgi:hypothetical protein
MATKARNIGAFEAAGALATLTDGDGAYMDYDAVGGNARFGAKGTAGANRGVVIATLLAGVLVSALTFTPAGIATFVNGIVINTGGLSVTAGGLTVSSGTSALQAVTATSIGTSSRISVTASGIAVLLALADATGYCAITFNANGAGVTGYIGADKANTLMAGSADGDIAIRANTKRILMSTDGGNTNALAISVTNLVTLTGLWATVASAAGSAGLRLPHGAAPAAPVNGDVWTTAAGLFVRVNGATVGPLT